MTARFRPSEFSSLTPWGNGLWQWYNWRWPHFAPHQFTTRTIWPIGMARFRDRAWQPDVSGWTLARFDFDMGNWAQQRHAPDAQVIVDMNTASILQARPRDTPPIPPVPPVVVPVYGVFGYLSGLILSGGGSQVLGISRGVATSDQVTALMWSPNPFTKTMGAFVPGTGLGGLDTGFVAPNTWYHVYMILRSDTQAVDFIMSTNPSTPAMPLPYDNKRRIGSILTDGSGNIVPFSQNFDEFLWVVTVGDAINALIGRASGLLILTVPLGIKVNALFRANANRSGTSPTVLFSSPDEADQLAFNAGPPGACLLGINGEQAAGQFNIRTNTLSEIRVNADLNGTQLYVNTFGWIDTRGK